MKSIKRMASRGGRLFAVLAFTAAVLAPSVLPAMQVDAALLTARKITMASTAPGSVTTDANGATLAAGSYGNGAQTIHTFDFSQATSGATVGSVVLQYCTSPLPGTTCTAPTGMDAATITSVTTNANFGAAFTVDTTTVANTGHFANQACSGTTPFRQNCVLLTRTAAAITGTPALQVVVGISGTNYIKNPTADGPFYVRLTTFATATYTTPVDDGAVAGSVNEEIDITAKVQEKLNFSVSGTTNAPGTTCASLPVGGSKVMGTGGVLDTSTASFVNSYYRLSTNAAGGTGTVVQYAGGTLRTTGGDVITALTTTAAASSPGTPQFGFTQDSTDTQAGNGYSLTNLTRTAPYNVDTTYAFDTTSTTSPKTIASATAGTTVTCDTSSVKYVGNIATTTKPGTYRTTIIFFAVPTF